MSMHAQGARKEYTGQHPGVVGDSAPGSREDARGEVLHSYNVLVCYFHNFVDIC